MYRINRNKVDDARSVFEGLLPDPRNRKGVCTFLAEAIEFASALNNDNWNLNVDSAGQLVRFNTGATYCVRIDRDKLIVLVDRAELSDDLLRSITGVTFVGGSGDNQVKEDTPEDLPDRLVDVPGSIACWLPLHQAGNFTTLLAACNRSYIVKAIEGTKIGKHMRAAHASGGVAYLAEYYAGYLTQPSYTESSTPTWKSWASEDEAAVTEALKRDQEERLERLRRAPKKTRARLVHQFVFDRNPDVVAEVLHRASGHCERCGVTAPFIRDSNGTPYLEVHHKKPLSEGGDDTVKNCIALCPNCHRWAHYGASTYLDNSF